jgi:hypothetical protein
MRFKKPIMWFILICISNASGIVYENHSIGFRIELGKEWERISSNDSVCTFEDTTAVKSTLLCFSKSTIDNAFETLGWARLHFAINKEVTIALGKVISYDTSESKKFGNHRAFELLGFSHDTMSNWRAVYSRWTEIGGFGYYAYVIGDTISVIRDSTRFKTIFDAIVIEPFTGTLSSNSAESVPLHLCKYGENGQCDLLGRSIPANADRIGAIQIRKSAIFCRLKQIRNR